MIKRCIPLALLLTAALGLALTPAAASAQTAQKVAVVNVGKVFNSMQEKKEIQQKLETETEKLQSDNKTHQAELQQMQEMIRNGPKPGTQQYDDLVHQLDEKTAQYAAEFKVHQVELTRSQTRQLKELYDKISDAVANLAKQQGISLVIAENQPEFPNDVSDMNPDTLSQMINQRNVMFVSPDIDLTAQVVTQLDAQYKSAGK